MNKLPRFFNEILNHPNTSDDLRRATESKLLRHKQRYLYAIPVSRESAALKARIAGELDSLVDGIVLLGIPDQMAWSLFINSKDCETIGGFFLVREDLRCVADGFPFCTEGYDFSTLRAYRGLFPSLPLTALVTGYFAYSGVPGESDADKGNKVTGEGLDVDVALDMMLVRFCGTYQLR